MVLDHCAPGIAPITKSRHLKCPSGPIDPLEPLQPEITATLVTLEAKNGPLNPPQTEGFQGKDDPLKRSVWTHLALSMTPITKSINLTCLLSFIDPCKPFQPEIKVTWVTLEAKNVPLNPPQKWGFQAKKTLSSDHFKTH